MPLLMATVTQMQIAYLIREGRLTNRPLACLYLNTASGTAIQIGAHQPWT